MIVDSFFSFLGAQSGVTSLCPSSKHFPLTIPEGTTPPAITFSLDAERREPLFDGQADLRESLIDVRAWHTDQAAAHALADAIETALVNYRGAFGSKTAEHIRIERKFDLFESDTGLYCVPQQFLIAYY